MKSSMESMAEGFAPRGLEKQAMRNDFVVNGRLFSRDEVRRIFSPEDFKDGTWERQPSGESVFKPADGRFSQVVLAKTQPPARIAPGRLPPRTGTEKVLRMQADNYDDDAIRSAYLPGQSFAQQQRLKALAQDPGNTRAQAAYGHIMDNVQRYTDNRKLEEELRNPVRTKDGRIIARDNTTGMYVVQATDDSGRKQEGAGTYYGGPNNGMTRLQVEQRDAALTKQMQEADASLNRQKQELADRIRQAAAQGHPVTDELGDQVRREIQALYTNPAASGTETADSRPAPAKYTPGTKENEEMIAEQRRKLAALRG